MTSQRESSVARETEEQKGVRLESSVALLTGGADRPYAFGLGTALIPRVAVLDVIGNDDLDSPQFYGKPGVNFLNLRGNQQPGVRSLQKAFRVAKYYARLICYAATAKSAIFHILWNNKFEFFDRTLLTLYYRLLGKRIVLTLHNVNAGIRDANDTLLNRLSLRIQYHLADHIFVHTEKMKIELMNGFGIPSSRITIIPFGINNSVPNTDLTSLDAKRYLGIRESEKTLLFFGHITPYKGLEYLTAAFRAVLAKSQDYRLIIAGRSKNCDAYWAAIKEAMQDEITTGRILVRAEFIPDKETEIYFKAADALVLPYTHIYQSGVLFLGYSFGLPVLAADVGSLKDDIIEGETGFVFKPEDPDDIANTIERYFASDVFKELDGRRQQIRDSATKQHSWDTVAEMTVNAYRTLSISGRTLSFGEPSARDAKASL